MTARLTYTQRMRRVIYSFPLQLLLLHVKKNHLLLLAWLILFGFVSGQLGVKYGVPFLFLYPEYFGEVSFLSYGILGFAVGGFITAFNLYSYTMHGYRFPFVATIARPFLKFTVNNAVIPVLFLLVYLWCSARFQYSKELVPPVDIVLHLSGFVFGVGLFMALSLLYFTSTNTDIIKLLGKEPEDMQPLEPLVDIIGPQHDAPPQRTAERRKATRWLRRAQRSEKWRVETYITPRLRVMLARSSAHYDKELLRSVLWQNHINGSIFEMVLVISFILLGAFSEVPLFAIPAGASAFLFFTMLLMVFSALFSWMQGWTVTVLIGAIVVLNLLSHKTEKFFSDNKAIGLDYSAAPARYDQPTIYALANDTAAAAADARAMQATLEQWARNNAKLEHPGEKPPMLVINTSGGGLRALLWTFRCLQYADSLSGGTLMQRTVLLTGSSGGLIGATYFRQLYLADSEHGGTERYDPTLLKELSNDILNPLAFSFVTNDMFVRYRKIKDGDRSYTMDRGAAFERRMNENTRGLLNVRMGDLAEAERQARIPMLVTSPTSINDGRRVVISALPAAYLTAITPDAPLVHQSEPEAIEFRRLFAEHDPDRLTLTGILRMNASFPYITPVVTLPSEPPMRVMDAGVRDNYGYRATLAYLHTFRDWIAEHTGGVVILQLRDMQKDLEVRPSAHSLFSRLTDPVGSIYDNFVRIQDQDYDLMLRQASGWTKFPMEVVDIQLRHTNEEHISLSWHLTALERTRVLRSLETGENQRSFKRLMTLLQGPGVNPLYADGGEPAPEADRAARP